MGAGSQNQRTSSTGCYAAIYDAGGGADLAAVEAELGLPAGQGQQAFDLIAGARAALDDGRITALREIDQG